MAKTKKFECRTVQDNKTWTAEIIRRVTSKKFHVSKSKQGFIDEAKALEWGEQEIKSFILNLSKRNKRQ